MEEQKSNESRKDYLLKVCMEFIESNNLEECKIFYDDTKCDGYCLLSDISANLEYGV